MRIDAMFTLYPPGTASKQQQETLALPLEKERIKRKSFTQHPSGGGEPLKKKYKMETMQPAQIINYAPLFKRLHLQKKKV